MAPSMGGRLMRATMRATTWRRRCGGGGRYHDGDRHGHRRYRWGGHHHPGVRLGEFCGQGRYVRVRESVAGAGGSRRANRIDSWMRSAQFLPHGLVDQFTTLRIRRTIKGSLQGREAVVGSWNSSTLAAEIGVSNSVSKKGHVF